MKKLILFIAFTIVVNSMSAQEWTKDFPKKINLVKMSDAGVAIVGTDDALYGIDETGKVLWKNEKLRKVEKERVEILSGSELVFISDKGLLARNRVLNVITGDEYANNGKSGNIMGAKVIHDTNQLWVVKGPRSLNVWDLDSNTLQYSWTKAIPNNMDLQKIASLTVSFKGTQPVMYTGEDNAIIHLALAHLESVNLRTGKSNWKFNWKPYKTKDGIASSLSNSFSAMKIDEATNTLYFPFRDQLIAVDAQTGNPKWHPKKGGKTGKVISMYIINEGILALTPKGLQLVDKASGNLVWKKPIKIKNAATSILLKDNDDFFAISKGSILEVDVANKTTKTLTEKIKFSGKESFDSLEVVDDLIILSSSQNVAAFDKNTGKKIHHTYLKAPGSSVLTIAQNITLAAVAVAATANSQNINSRNTSGSTYRYHSYTPAVMKSGGSATTKSGNIMYVSTKFKDKDAKGFGIAKVDKKTGEVLEKIVIGDRDPLYAINHNKGNFFYKSDKKTLSMKNLK